MRRLLVLGVILAGCAAASGPASAGGAFLSGQVLLNACNGDAESKALCSGYIAGVGDVFDCEHDVSGFHWNPEEKGVTIGQLREVVLKFLRDHPEKLNHIAPDLIAEALSTAFLCK